MQPDYYSHKLYPLQDQVLKVLQKSKTQFYLTGGTALSRVWLKHRYSDDLYFFMNRSDRFKEEVALMAERLTQEFPGALQRLIDTSEFHRWLLSQNEVELKIELINDVSYRHGQITATKLFFRTDHPLNILSNKISALSRNEAKDVADILFLDEAFDFSWPEMIEHAKQKDLSVNEIEVANTLGNYDVRLLESVRWVERPDFDWCSERLHAMARRIVEA